MIVARFSSESSRTALHTGMKPPTLYPSISTPMKLKSNSLSFAHISVHTASGIVPMMFWRAVPGTDTRFTLLMSFEYFEMFSRISESTVFGIRSSFPLTALFSLPNCLNLSRNPFTSSFAKNALRSSIVKPKNFGLIFDTPFSLTSGVFSPASAGVVVFCVGSCCPLSSSANSLSRSLRVFSKSAISSSLAFFSSSKAVTASSTVFFSSSVSASSIAFSNSASLFSSSLRFSRAVLSAFLFSSICFLSINVLSAIVFSLQSVHGF